MELCMTQAVSNLPQTPERHIFSTLNPINLHKPTYSLPLRRAPIPIRLHSRFLCSSESFPRAPIPKATSDRPNSNLDETLDISITVRYPPPAEKNVDGDESESKEESSGDEQTQTLDLKLKMNYATMLLLVSLLGGCLLGPVLLTIWLAKAFVGAIYATPLFLKVMEIVGISYSVWFTTRYLLSKKKLKELVLKLEELTS